MQYLTTIQVAVPAAMWVTYKVIAALVGLFALVLACAVFCRERSRDE